MFGNQIYPYAIFTKPNDDFAKVLRKNTGECR